MKKMGRLILLLLAAGSLQATSHCYKQRSNCFVEKDGRQEVKMYIKRERFATVAKEHGVSEKRLEEMLRRGEGHEEYREGEDLRDERGYYGGVYWPHPVYAYPPHYAPPHRPRPPHRPPEQKPPERPVTIQPTENPLFHRPRPQRPSTRPVPKPSARPAARPRPVRRGR